MASDEYATSPFGGYLKSRCPLHTAGHTVCSPEGEIAYLRATDPDKEQIGNSQSMGLRDMFHCGEQKTPPVYINRCPTLTPTNTCLWVLSCGDYAEEYECDEDELTFS